MTIDEWLDYGRKNGFCSYPTCDTHEIVTMTDDEARLFNEGESDPCIYVVRLHRK